MAYRTTTLFDVVSSAADAVTGMQDILTPALKQQQDAKLKQQQIDMQTSTSDFLRSLEGRTDWDNFEDAAKQFMQEKRDQYAESYRGDYAKRTSAEMFQTSEASLMENVKDAAFKGIRESTLQTNLHTLDELGNLPADQARMDQASEIINSSFSQGLIDEGTRNSLLSKQANNTAAQMCTDYYNRIIADNPNASDAQLQKMMDEYTQNLDVHATNWDGTVLSFTPDGETVKATASKAAWSQLNEARDNNNKDIVKQNTKIIDDVYRGNVTAQQGIVNIDRQIGILKNTPNTKLSAEDQRSRIMELESYRKQLEQMTTASTPKAKSGTTKAFDYNTLMNNAKTARTELLKDVVNARHRPGTTVWDQKNNYDSWLSKQWAPLQAEAMDYYMNEQGMSYSDAQTQVAFDYDRYIKPIGDEWADYAEKNGIIPNGTASVIKDACSDLAKTCQKMGMADMSGDLENFIYESLFATDYNQFGGNSKQATEYINNLVTKYQDQVCAKKIDNTIYNAGSKKYERYDPEEAKEKDTLGFVRAQKENIHYTVGNTGDSNVHYSGSMAEALYGQQGTMEINGKGADTLENDLVGAMYTGGKASGKKTDLSNMNITRTFESTEDGSDITGTILFTVSGTGNPDYDGYSFRYTESDGKVVLEKKKDGERNWKSVSRGKTEDMRKAMQGDSAAATKAAKDKVGSMETPQEPAAKDYMRPEGMDDQTWQRISAGASPWEINQKVDAWKKEQEKNKK